MKEYKYEKNNINFILVVFLMIISTGCSINKTIKHNFIAADNFNTLDTSYNALNNGSIVDTFFISNKLKSIELKHINLDSIESYRKNDLDMYVYANGEINGSNYLNSYRIKIEKDIGIDNLIKSDTIILEEYFSMMYDSYFGCYVYTSCDNMLSYYNKSNKVSKSVLKREGNPVEIEAFYAVLEGRINAYVENENKKMYTPSNTSILIISLFSKVKGNDYKFEYWKIKR
jgi:hypothetical protein